MKTFLTIIMFTAFFSTSALAMTKAECDALDGVYVTNEASGTSFCFVTISAFDVKGDFIKGDTPAEELKYRFNVAAKRGRISITTFVHGEPLSPVLSGKIIKFKAGSDLSSKKFVGTPGKLMIVGMGTELIVFFKTDKRRKGLISVRAYNFGRNTRRAVNQLGLSRLPTEFTKLKRTRRGRISR